MGCSIQAVLKAVSELARFWERGSRFLGTWRALLCGEVMRVEAAGGDLQCFLEDRLFGIKKLSGVVQAKYLRRTYSGQSLTLRR